MEYYNCYNDELYHHGVKGMKWGVRKKPDAAKVRYRSAKKAYKEARKEFRQTAGFGIGIKGIAQAKKAQNKLNKAEMDFISEKARYKGRKGSKAELKTYVKEMRKSGLAGSYADDQSGGRSTRLYNRLKQEKGKTYADNVMKKVEKSVVTDLVTTAAVGVGLMTVSAILQAQDG